MASFNKYDQSVIYIGTEEYTQFIRNTFQSEKATICGCRIKSGMTWRVWMPDQVRHDMEGMDAGSSPA